jgi:hypothetical protein
LNLGRYFSYAHASVILSEKVFKRDTGISLEILKLLYPTFKNLGDNFGISESYTNKIYHYILSILVQDLKLDVSKTLVNEALDVLAIDVTEQEIERSIKKQKRHYSGKKRHSIKIQLIICLFSMKIICVQHGVFC